jgi:autotransporter strand-loop-strand O-heptosyltransferase
MKYQLAYSYQNTKRNLNNFNFLFNFTDGAKVTILGVSESEFKVKFIDQDSSNLVYETKLKSGMWAAPRVKYFVNWSIQVFKDDQLIREERLSLNKKEVKIVFDTSSLGDSIAYIEHAEAFRLKHNCNIYCVVFNKELCKIFSEKYPFIKFNNFDFVGDFYAIYKIQYPIENWNGFSKKDPRTISLTEIPALALGLDVVERKPNLAVQKKSDKKYVCIATQSTAQCKYWNNKDGWSSVIKHLNNLGYEVWCIDRYPIFGTNGSFNHIPNGAIDKTGEFSLETRIEQISGADFFIGLGSGLSWLAWACGVPVVLISGFSKSFAEFSTPYRVINENVCNGCWNDPSLTFDRTNWKWCPRNKDFECSKQISAKMVIDKIDLIINFDKKKDDTASIILCHPNSPKKIELLKKCIESSSGTKIVSSNYQLDDEVQKISDYCLVSNKNEILKQEDFSKFRVDYYLTTNTASGVLRKRFEFEHGYAVYCLIRDGLRFAKSLGFKTVHVINYDYLISEETFKNHLSALKDNDCVFYDYQKEYYDKDSFNTGFFSGKTDALLSFFEHYKTKSEYYSEPTFPINILEIKTFDFFDKSGLKIFKIPNNKIREGGNEVNIVAVSWEDEQINIPP